MIETIQLMMLSVEEKSAFQSDKIIPFTTAQKIVSKLKKQGKTIGLCHGGFDLLHPGHMLHFESAKKICDKLIVSITTDTYVSLRKNIGRPIFSETIRAYAAASITYVDYVVISHYKEATEIIKKIKPSYYIKGPDYIHKKTPGITKERQAIKSVGGTIEYTTEPALSTTKIIDYIKNNVKRENILVLIDRDGTLIKDDHFIGKNDNWADELTFNLPVIQFLSYIQTKEQTTNIVISNQAGIARGYFNEKRVEEINTYIDDFLEKNSIIIHNWQYCPDVDANYAHKSKIQFKPEYIKEKNKRKHSTEMINDALIQLQTPLQSFKQIFVIGDRHEDKGIADKINAHFINVTNKTYGDLIHEYEKNRKN